jgi:hypothetical protein
MEFDNTQCQGDLFQSLIRFFDRDTTLTKNLSK